MSPYSTSSPESSYKTILAFIYMFKQKQVLSLHSSFKGQIQVPDFRAFKALINILFYSLRDP